jgi:hypothetical protein
MAFPRSFDAQALEFCRRRFLIGALGTGVALTHASRIFAASDFWNTKDPSTWTEDEIHILTTKSPWARTATPAVKGADDPTEAPGGGAGRGGRGGPGFRTAVDPIIVRWESAQPILDAFRAPLAAELNGHYVLSVTNLPLPSTRRPGPGREAQAAPDDTLDRLQNGATLQAKDKDPAEAGIVRRTRIGSILFGFSRDYLHLTPSDRDIVFKLDTGTITLSTKFDGKEMSYHGKLAV